MNTTHDRASLDAALTELVRFFEQLSSESVSQLPLHYAADVRFKDPFNEVQGLAGVEHIFRHMFVQLEQPRFIVRAHLLQGRQAFLTWDFCFRFRRFDTVSLQTVRGATHLIFNDHGLVVEHRDYWDAAEELYEKLPMVGGLMRWLKARARS
ncbi:MAG: nuclear transport factor 2 family protein [Alphaproteobacteria bacterium]|nr:nuclear transport factor 2 family protein [Alphaproteobacteria bacterium]